MSRRYEICMTLTAAQIAVCRGAIRARCEDQAIAGMNTQAIENVARSFEQAVTAKRPLAYGRKT